MESRIYCFPNDAKEWVGKDADAKKVLGGKGAALMTMSLAELPVPPGFTITTTVCNAYRVAADKKAFMDDLMFEVDKYDTWLGQQFGFMPLVSVRSGAPVSMPGMMDTILNVGLTIEQHDEWEKRIGQRAAADSARRLAQMLGSTAYGVPHDTFEALLVEAKLAKKVTDDTELDTFDLLKLTDAYHAAFWKVTGQVFPQTRYEQLRAAIIAVFDSWMNPRAIEYRKINKLNEDMGTAVTVQAMVFGNMGDTSGSGVLFTRDPSTGENVIMAEYLENAQGEDVVAGIRTPDKLVFGDKPTKLSKGTWMGELAHVCEALEVTYRDMVDVEFTVQQNKLYILQSRAGKRSARAAFKIAVDLLDEGVITEADVMARLTCEQFKVVRRPMIDPAFGSNPNHTGIPACPGVVYGRPVFSAEEAVAAKDAVILVTHETTPDDIAGMNAAVGILTQTGGATSHAAVVARAMDKTCIVGCTDLDIAKMKEAGTTLTRVTLDGSTGRVWFNVEVPVIDASDSPELKRVTDMCFNSLGATVTCVVPEMGAENQVISAAAWWGHEDAMNAVLQELVSYDDLTGITLDIRSPRELGLTGVKNPLDAVFRDLNQHDNFRSMLSNRLMTMSAGLSGLSILCNDNDGIGDMLAVCGFHKKTLADMTAVPRDYAVFKALA